MYKRNALISGAANGIGKSIARRLHCDGFYCFIVDVDDERGEELAKSIGNKSRYIHCDVSEESEVIRLFSFFKQEGIALDALINNAGIIKDNLIWKMPAIDFDSVLNINLKGTWLMCREASRIMMEQRSGRIVNISSRAWLGNSGQSNYSASKAGVVSLTRVMALELGQYGVLVNAIAPGLIDTPLVQGLSEEVRGKLIRAQPTGKMGRPEDVAHVVAFLCNENTQFLTGQTIYVDGGRSIGAMV